MYGALLGQDDLRNLQNIGKSDNSVTSTVNEGKELVGLTIHRNGLESPKFRTLSIR